MARQNSQKNKGSSNSNQRSNGSPEAGLGGSPIGDWSNGSQTISTSGGGTTVGSLKKSVDDRISSSVGKISSISGAQRGSQAGYKKHSKKEDQDV